MTDRTACHHVRSASGEKKQSKTDAGVGGDDEMLLEAFAELLRRGRTRGRPTACARSVCTYATMAQTCSLVSSSENVGIFGVERPFQTL